VLIREIRAYFSLFLEFFTPRAASSSIYIYFYPPCLRTTVCFSWCLPAAPPICSTLFSESYVLKYCDSNAPVYFDLTCLKALQKSG
jgi:hypothetical protein